MCGQFLVVVVVVVIFDFGFKLEVHRDGKR